MIDYETFCRIHALHEQEGLTICQIAKALQLHEDTVSRWLKRARFVPRKLDPFKGRIVALLERHPYSAIQLFQRMKEEGYEGGYSILKKFVRTVRPQREKAFLSLHFEPGECAQIDWGHCGMINVGNTRRRLTHLLQFGHI